MRQKPVVRGGRRSKVVAYGPGLKKLSKHFTKPLDRQHNVSEITQRARRQEPYTGDGTQGRIVKKALTKKKKRRSSKHTHH